MTQKYNANSTICDSVSPQQNGTFQFGQFTNYKNNCKLNDFQFSI